jgi:virulence factor Mce-like protein
MAKTKQNLSRLAGLLSFLAFLGFAYFAVTAGSKAMKDEKYITLYVNDALGLVKDSSVMIAGVDVGRVTDLSVAHDKARITIALDPAQKIPRRVRGIVRARSLLGEKFLELVPVEDKPGDYMRGGEVIDASDTTKTLELDQFVTEFDPLIDRVSSFLDSVNPKDPSKPNLIDNLARASGSLAEGLDGKEEALGNLVDNVNQVTTRVDGIFKRNSERGGRVFENLDAVLVDSKRSQFVPRLSEAATDLSTLANEVKSQKTVGKLDKVLVRLDPILARAEKIDETALRKFLQDEGIKGHVRLY